MDLELSGKRAIVTGGGSGIGFAIASELSREGVKVAIVGRREDVLAPAAKRISAETGNVVLPVVADTGVDSTVRNMVDVVVAEFGGVDILVNVASENPAQPGGLTYEHATDEAFTRQLNVKVIGYLRTARAVAPYFINQGWGRIINISGVGARKTYSVINSVRNSGVTALTKNLADELGPHGVNANVLYPGHTMSEQFQERLEREAADAGVSFDDYIASIDTQNAIGRFVKPEEVGWVAAFLASPKSVTISGESITVGGGLLGTISY
ncbi:SDR family oxidoreductase [Streptomyces sp. CA-106131]|uniref:SDR family oxidoreductase n=1 Tax=Streptomyces sp. CA-106131 TaxID=3240045 RepID=UPI003D8AA482